ncbi:transporter [Paeniclostridium sordellii]|uniref:potassium channel family protein n=1 Tax=Paraclostridium sordellii TaxID=1505 RepID=UPI0012EE467C|nr:potassium channel family protein [Paeniclostridium sordellii]MDU2687890.1 potassium channel family protein [Paeniclostridium sordellii]MDU6249658.1 potassium channel family protein [Paeniclostridium sordellii]MVO71801.1 transporter [Paeniclostridium sordellii]
MSIKKYTSENKNNKNKHLKKLVFEESTIINNDNIGKFNIDENIDFSNLIFLKDVIFDNCVFKKDAVFLGTEFNGDVSFNKCIFNEDCVFKNTKFNKNTCINKIFVKSEIKGQKIVFDKVENMPRLDGMLFSQCCKVNIKNIMYDKQNYKNAKINYRIAKNQAGIIGDYEQVSHYYYMERYYGGKCIKRSDFNNTMEYINLKFVDALSRYIIGYGEKPLNIFLISFLIVSIFAILYMITGVENNNTVDLLNSNSNESFFNFIKKYIDVWYFSMATFSTVGYGDIVVTSIYGKLLASIEVFLGVTIGASWASVLFRKMSR